MSSYLLLTFLESIKNVNVMEYGRDGGRNKFITHIQIHRVCVCVLSYKIAVTTTAAAASSSNLKALQSNWMYKENI